MVSYISGESLPKFPHKFKRVKFTCEFSRVKSWISICEMMRKLTCEFSHVKACEFLFMNINSHVNLEHVNFHV